MLKIFITIGFYFLFSGTGEACTIKSNDRLLLVSPKKDFSFKEIGETSRCQSSQIQSFLRLVQDGKGVLRQSIIQNEGEDLKNIKISPSVIHIEHLSEIIKSHLSLDDKTSITSISPLQDNAIFKLSSAQSLSFVCQSCQHRLGNHNIKMEVSNALTGQKKTHWLRVDIKKEVTALVPKHGLDVTHESLTPEDFKKKQVLTSDPHDIFQDHNRINYYKLNRTVAKGEPLKSNMLSPQQLVSPGTPANIFLNNHKIRLSGKAMPMQSASYGEVVKLRNPKNNQIITGKVIDYNRVKVGL